MFKCPTQFLCKKRNNYQPDFQLIDHALKPGPEPFVTKSALSALNTSIFNDITLVLYWKLVLTLLAQIPQSQSSHPLSLVWMMIKCLCIAQGEGRGC